MKYGLVFKWFKTKLINSSLVAFEKNLRFLTDRHLDMQFSKTDTFRAMFTAVCVPLSPERSICSGEKQRLFSSSTIQSEADSLLFTTLNKVTKYFVFRIFFAASSHFITFLKIRHVILYVLDHQLHIMHVFLSFHVDSTHLFTDRYTKA